jgi:hypothetical protein
MSKRETIRRLRVGDVRRVLQHRCGATLPDDDAGRDDLDLLLRLHAVASNAAEKKMRCEVEISAPWMPKAEATDQIDSLCDAIASRLVRWQRARAAAQPHERRARGVEGVAHRAG